MTAQDTKAPMTPEMNAALDKMATVSSVVSVEGLQAQIVAGIAEVKAMIEAPSKVNVDEHAQSMKAQGFKMKEQVPVAVSQVANLADLRGEERKQALNEALDKAIAVGEKSDPNDDAYLSAREKAFKPVPQVFNDQQIINAARTAHEVNRAYCVGIGDNSQKAWDDAEAWQRISAIKGVEGVIAGAGPGQSHENWLKEKEETGWKYGPVKDSVKKEHPCFLPFDELPEQQQFKDHLFVNVVASVLELDR